MDQYVPEYHPSKPGESSPEKPKPSRMKEQPASSPGSPVIQCKRVQVCSRGSPTSLVCSVSGTPTPSVEWFQEGKGACQGTKYRALCEPPLFYLVISDTCSQDAGQYSIVARNECGENSFTILMSVLTPAAPDSKLNMFQINFLFHPAACASS